MKRYAQTLLRFWSTSVSAEMEYRANFVLTAIQSTLALGGALFVLWSLFRTGYQMGGWDWPSAMLVVAAYTVMEGFASTFLTPNREQVGEMVREGTLDFVLLKPIDTQFWLSARKVRVWGVPNLVLGWLLAGFAWTRLGGGDAAVEPSVWGAVGFVAALGLGLVILYAMGYLLSTLTIWFVKMNNITIAMQSLLEAGRYPVSAYPAAYRVFFTFVLPVAFMTTTPAELVTGRAGAEVLAVAAGAAGVLLLGSRWFWRRALRSYTSASS
ncbi:MAG: ABC-2 family transporter protein [Planctomycetota bacterium]